MRKNEIIKGAGEVLSAIDESEIFNIFQKLAERAETEEKINTLTTIKALKVYTLKAYNFSYSAQKLAKILKLDFLTDEAFWIHTINIRPERISIYYQQINQAKIFLPKVIELLENDVINEVKESSETESSKYKDKEILSVIISEPDDRFSTPERIVEVLESISLFYEVFAIINNQNAHELSVVACDSGSDKSFDFLGAAKIMESIKELIITLWDRIVFYRERQLHERLSLISESLPIIEYIGTLENENKIEREQAEILRRKILNGTDKFLNSGAIIPEMEKESTHNPHLLMTPAPKLLVAAPKEMLKKPSAKRKKVNKPVKDENENLEDFTPEELELLKKLAGKLPKTSNKPKTTGTRKKDNEEN